MTLYDNMTWRSERFGAGIKKYAPSQLRRGIVLYAMWSYLLRLFECNRHHHQLLFLKLFITFFPDVSAKIAGRIQICKKILNDYWGLRIK